MNYLSINHVTKQFKTILAVNDVSFTLPKGQFVALLGPNGAGKTTLVEMIEGIQRPDTGYIILDQKNWDSHATLLRKKMGVCLQETKYMDYVTVKEMIRLFTDIFKVPQARVNELTERLGANHYLSQYVTALSGGQRQKLSLLLALIHDPEFLILDEPSTGLDPQIRREIWDLLLTYKEKGLTLLLTTHYMEEAECLCDRIMLMDQGKIIQDGTLNTILQLVDEHDILNLSVSEIGKTPNLSMIPDITRMDWNPETGSGWIHFKNQHQQLEKILSALNDQSFHIQRLAMSQKTLEDVFISLTGRKLHD